MKRIAIRKNPGTRPARGARGWRAPRSAFVASRPHVSRTDSVEGLRFAKRARRRTSGRTPATLAGVGTHNTEHARSPPGRSRSKPLRSSLDEFTIFRIRAGPPHDSVGPAPPRSSRGLPSRSRGRRSRCRPRSNPARRLRSPPRPARRKGAAVPRTPTPASRRPRRSEL